MSLGSKLFIPMKKWVCKHPKMNGTKKVLKEPPKFAIFVLNQAVEAQPHTGKLDFESHGPNIAYNKQSAQKMHDRGM